MRLPRIRQEPETPWDRRYPVPLGGAQAGNSGHVADHNTISRQLPELWAEAESLHRQVDQLRFWIIVLAVLILGLGICLAFVA